MRLWTEEHPDEDRAWYVESNYLVCLQVPTEVCLNHLASQMRDAGIAHSMFHEPDLANSATALAIAPAGAKLVANLPLALRSKS